MYNLRISILLAQVKYVFAKAIFYSFACSPKQKKWSKMVVFVERWIHATSNLNDIQFISTSRAMYNNCRTDCICTRRVCVRDMLVCLKFVLLLRPGTGEAICCAWPMGCLGAIPWSFTRWSEESDMEKDWKNRVVWWFGFKGWEVRESRVLYFMRPDSFSWHF